LCYHDTIVYHFIFGVNSFFENGKIPYGAGMKSTAVQASAAVGLLLVL